jgi:hypothetical protein
MHVEDAFEIVCGKFTLEIDLLVWINLVPCLVDRKEEGEFGGGVKEMSRFGCENASQIGQTLLRRYDGCCKVDSDESI